MEVPRAICIRPRQDRLQPIVPSGVRELVAPQPNAGVVVGSVRVRLPEVDARAADRTTPTRQHVAAEGDARTPRSRYEDRVAHGRRLEVRPADLPGRQAESVAGGVGCTRRSSDRGAQDRREASGDDARAQVRHERH